MSTMTFVSAASGRSGRRRAGAGTARCSSRRCRSRSAGSRRPRAPRRRSRGRCARRAAARATAIGTSGASTATPASSSARVAGSLKAASPSRRLRCVIHTAPSTVARQIAPSRWAMISPGAPRSVALAVDAEEVELRARDRVEHAGVALGRRGACAAPCRSDPRSSRSRGPSWRHQRARPAGRRAVAGSSGSGPRHRRRPARPPRRSPRSRRGGPRGGTGCSCPPARMGNVRVAQTVAGVELAVGLEHGHAPLVGAELDRPVQRGGPAVAARAGVHDQAAVRGPDRLRDELLEHRADDQLRPVRARPPPPSPRPSRPPRPRRRGRAR